MNELFADAFSAFCQSGIVLLVAAVVVWSALRLLQPQSPGIHRLAWGGVLLCGVLVFPISLKIPWYDSEPVAPAVLEANSEASVDLTELELRGPHSGDSIAPSVTAATTAPPTTSSIDWAGWMIGIWIAGMAGTLFLAAASYALLLVSLRRATRADAAWHEQWTDLLRSEGVKNKIPLWVHPTAGPMLCRLPRGYVVVIPEEIWATFTVQQRAAILRHELAHYQRGDVWMSLLARLLAVPHWYNPLAWWAVRKFDEGGEWACDQRLLADPQLVPAFARALLAMTRPEANRVCTSAAGGSPLSLRLCRLLTLQTPEDSFMKRSLLLAVVLGLLCVGLLRVQLVSRAQEDDSPASVERETEERIADVTQQLSKKGLTGELKTALETTPGQIVLQDYISHYADDLREQARRNALPGYFDKHFVQESGRYRLREGKDQYRQQFLATAGTFNEDVEKIGRAMRELSAEIAGQSEADRLLVRFMNHEAAPVMLYVEELRARMRPDDGALQRQLGETFVETNGRYIVRPGAREELEHHVQSLQHVSRKLKPIRAELQMRAKELVEKDDFHRRVKKTLAEPLFAAFVASELIEDGPRDFERRQQEFFDNLGYMVVDTADGLAIVEDEAREEIEDVLKQFDRVSKAATKLAKPLATFADKIEQSGDLERDCRELLKSDLAKLRIGADFEFADAEPAEIVRDLLGEAVEQDENDRLFVSQEQSEEVTEFVREMLRQYRSVRMRGRVLDDMAKQLDDTELREAYLSMGGKFVVLRELQRSLGDFEAQGLKMWVDEHFQPTDAGLVLQQDAETMAREFLEDVANVNKELENDDF